MNRSRLEMYVENYLRSHKIALGEQNYLRKAKAYIDYALFYDECDFTEPVLDLYTLRDNQFTRTVYNMLLNIGISLYRKSLQRTSDLLGRYIAGPCCRLVLPNQFHFKLGELEALCPIQIDLVKDNQVINGGVCYISPPIASIYTVLDCLNSTNGLYAIFSYDASTNNIIISPLIEGVYTLLVQNVCS